MKRFVVLVVGVLAAVGADAAVFERFLSPDNPADRAIIRYVELERSGQASSNDLAELGVLLLDKGFPKDAERYLKKALRADRHNYEASYRLGLVYQRVGRERAAIRAYRRTLRRRPGHTYARFMLALAQERAGSRNAAIENYVHAYRHLPQLADPSFNPLVLTSELQTEAALLHFQRVERMTAFRPAPIDPSAVREMMRVMPAEVADETPADVHDSRAEPVEPKAVPVQPEVLPAGPEVREEAPARPGRPIQPRGRPQPSAEDLVQPLPPQPNVSPDRPGR